MLNLIKVRYCENATIESQDFYIKLNNINKQCDNCIITFKVMLYICCLLTKDELNENMCIVTCDDIHNKLSISDVKYFECALTYLSSI